MNKRNCLLRFYCVCLWLKQAGKQKGKYFCSHWLSINVEQDGAECCGTGTRELLLQVFTRIWTISLWLGLEFTEAPVLMSTLTGGLSRFSWSSNIETFTHNLVKSFQVFSMITWRNSCNWLARSWWKCHQTLGATINKDTSNFPEA